MTEYDVFISYKQTDSNGNTTEDYTVAEQLFQSLSEKGLSVFFSSESIFRLGIGDYKKGIDAALDSAKVLVVIATKKDYLFSGWIEYEYETFYEDVLSGRKPGGIVVSYTSGETAGHLPRTLARSQNYILEQLSVDALSEYLQNAIAATTQAEWESASSGIVKTTESVAESVVQRTQKKFGKQKSVYVSDYNNELKRLEVQARNSEESDRLAVSHVFENSSWDPDEQIWVLDVGSAYGYVAANVFSGIEQVGGILCIDINQRVIERAQIIFAEDQKMVFEVVDVESSTFEDDMIELMHKYDIHKFHIVYSALTLHHLKNPEKLLRRLRKIMAENSFIVLRGSDDGSKLCYPNSSLMEEIIERTMEVEGVSDRVNGRKIYTQLTNSGFRDVTLFSVMKDLSHIEYDDRGALFEESFSYRENYFRRALEANPNSQNAKDNLAWMQNALMEFENQFFQRDFWYCEYDYIGVGKK